MFYRSESIYSNYIHHSSCMNHYVVDKCADLCSTTHLINQDSVLINCGMQYAECSILSRLLAISLFVRYIVCFTSKVFIYSKLLPMVCFDIKWLTSTTYCEACKAYNLYQTFNTLQIKVLKWSFLLHFCSDLS